MLGWYVGKSKPQKEQWLISCLAHLDVETFYPKFIQTQRGSYILEPLFPTYIFCRFDPDSPKWPATRWAPGVAYFLGADGRPTSIPDDVVEHLRSKVEWWNAGGFRKGFKAGDRVLITRGPFAGLEAIFQGYVPARRRCRILLQIVGRLAPVEIPEPDLEPGLLRF